MNAALTSAPSQLTGLQPGTFFGPNQAFLLTRSAHVQDGLPAHRAPNRSAANSFSRLEYVDEVTTPPLRTSTLSADLHNSSQRRFARYTEAPPNAACWVAIVLPGSRQNAEISSAASGVASSSGPT